MRFIPLQIDGKRDIRLGQWTVFAAFDRPISAEQALTIGLATEVVDDAQGLEESAALARELARKSVNAFAACKQLLNDAFDTSLETQLERERAALSACAEHADGAEGLRAFSEKRKPHFTSR